MNHGAQERTANNRNPTDAERANAVSARPRPRIGQPGARAVTAAICASAGSEGQRLGAAEALSLEVAEGETMKQKPGNRSRDCAADELGTAAVRSLPDRIRVAGYDLRIEKWTANEASGARRWGEFSSIEQVIRIQRNMPTPFKAVDTFLHELTHAIFWAYGLEDEDKEERIVSTMGVALMTAHRDNPWLAPWIAEALK